MSASRSRIIIVRLRYSLYVGSIELTLYTYFLGVLFIFRISDRRAGMNSSTISKPTCLMLDEKYNLLGTLYGISESLDYLERGIPPSDMRGHYLARHVNVILQRDIR